MTTNIFGTLFAALFSPIALLVLAAAIIVMAPIAPFYIVFYAVHKELRLRRARQQHDRVIRAAMAMHNAALSQANPTNN